MQTFLGVKVDTATMTTEEFETARNTIRGILANVNHQITIGYLVNHGHSSNNLDELVNYRNNIQEMLSNIEHQIVARKIAKHRHPISSSS